MSHFVINHPEARKIGLPPSIHVEMVLNTEGLLIGVSEEVSTTLLNVHYLNYFSASEGISSS